MQGQFLFTVLCVLLLVEGKRCTKQPNPFAQELVGQAAWFYGCSSLSQKTEVRITKWAVVVKTSNLFYYDGLICDDDIYVPYNKADKPAMLYHRSARLSKDRKTCVYSTKKVFVWGRTRKNFKRIISRAASNAVMIRQYRVCSDLQYRNHTYAEVQTWLKHDRVCNAVLNYFTAIAYRNFFRINHYSNPNVFC